MAASIANWFSFKIKNNKCWPIVRCELITKSIIAFENGETEKGIFYESKSLYCGFLANKVHHNDSENQIIDDFTLSDAINIQPDKRQDLLINFVTQKMAGIVFRTGMDQINNNNDNTNGPHCGDDGDGVKDLFDKCAQLPAEWNVVQLVKSSITHAAYGTKKDIYSEPAPISVTLFCHSLSEQMDNKPLSVRLGFEDEATGILAAAYELYEVSFKDYEKSFHHHEVQRKINAGLSKLISDLKTWLGPWVVFFTGKIKGDAGKQFEKRIFSAVNEFIARNSEFGSKQTLLLSLVSRRIDLLDSYTIKVAAEHIADTYPQYLAIAKFLAGIKTSFNFDNHSYYPCILILDEYLDKIPWEMFVPAEEIARFSSMYLLFEIYNEYKNDISDGYLKISVNTGNALINPGADTKLSSMEKRMTDFVSKWMPHWKTTIGGIPDPSLINELYETADVFFYAGHGPSLQFANTAELCKLKTKAIMLLFGCESNALKLHGLVTEPTSTHLTLHNSKCPAIFGGNCIISDVWSDMWSISLLTYWIPSTQLGPFQPILISDDLRKSFDPIHQKFKNKTEPSILRIIAEIRQLPGVLLRMRAAFVYRGLPMYNIFAES